MRRPTTLLGKPAVAPENPFAAFRNRNIFEGSLTIPLFLPVNLSPCVFAPWRRIHLPRDDATALVLVGVVSMEFPDAAGYTGPQT